MLVRSPLSELRQVVENRLTIGMEDVRPVLVYQYTRSIVNVIRVAADMGASVDNQHLLVTLRCEPLGDDAAGEPGPDYKPIKHGRLRSHAVKGRHPARPWTLGRFPRPAGPARPLSSRPFLPRY